MRNRDSPDSENTHPGCAAALLYLAPRPKRKFTFAIILKFYDNIFSCTTEQRVAKLALSSKHTLAGILMAALYSDSKPERTS
jgi:hypothetical protein